MVRWKTIKQLEFPPPLTQSQITFLETLAKDGPTNPYQVQKKTRKSYSLMSKAAKELMKRGMVKFEGKEKTEKRTMANIYDLTLEGVLFVLENQLSFGDIERWNYNFIHKIIRKYESLLPLVFGKWSYLRKMGVPEKIALNRLSVLAQNRERFKRGDPTFPGVDKEEKICWFFYFWGYYPILQHDSFPGIVADPKVWKNVWKQDEEVRAYIVKKFREEQKSLRNRSIFVEKILSFLET